MPDFPEVFRTKEGLDAFNAAYQQLTLTGLSNLAEAKAQLMATLQSLKKLTETVKGYPELDARAAGLVTTFKAACQNPAQNGAAYDAAVRDLNTTVQRCVMLFLNDGVAPDDVDPEAKMRAKEEAEYLAMRERVRAATLGSGNLLKEKQEEDARRMEEERAKIEALKAKERELIERAKREASSMPRSPSNQGGLASAAGATTVAAPVYESKPASAAPSELQRSISQLKLSEAAASPAASPAKPLSRPVAGDDDDDDRRHPDTSTTSSALSGRKDGRHAMDETEIGVQLSLKCKVCRDRIVFGRAMKCTSCGITVHIKCCIPSSINMIQCDQRGVF